jgi:hypothetical protein
MILSSSAVYLCAMNLRVTPVHFQLLCHSIEVDKTKALLNAKKLLKDHQVDWEELYLRAEMNAVKPQLHRLLKQFNPGLVPESFLEKLGLAVRENLFRQLQNTAEYFRVKEHLDAAGVTAVLFKGFSLATEFYENPADRESVDVDLFIDANDLDKVKPFMTQRGYVAEAPLDELTDTYIVEELCEYNFDRYSGEERIFHFEFHWRLSMTVFGMDITLAELQPQVTTGMIQHTTVLTFTPSAHLLLVIMHHGAKDQFLQLKQLLDVSRILLKEDLIDWQWVISNAEKYHVDKVLYVAINLASQLSETPIPLSIRQKVSSAEIDALARNRVSRMANRKDWEQSFANRLDDFYFQLKTRDNLKLQTGMIRHEIRRNILPGMIPKRFRGFFLDKKIRKKEVIQNL